VIVTIFSSDRSFWVQVSWVGAVRSGWQQTESQHNCLSLFESHLVGQNEKGCVVTPIWRENFDNPRVVCSYDSEDTWPGVFGNQFPAKKESKTRDISLSVRSNESACFLCLRMPTTTLFSCSRFSFGPAVLDNAEEEEQNTRLYYAVPT
jgi:hypothetical protein